MNDNEKPNNIFRDIEDIIESFAPSYSKLLSQNIEARKQILTSMISYWSIIVASFIYNLLHNFDTSYIKYSILAVVFSAAGLWRVNCLEKIFGIWKWDYKAIANSRLKYPIAWRFDPTVSA
jgi:hypothetical protein